MASPLETASPAFLSHRTTVPSSMAIPVFGMMMLCAIVLLLRRTLHPRTGVADAKLRADEEHVVGKGPAAHRLHGSRHDALCKPIQAGIDRGHAQSLGKTAVAAAHHRAVPAGEQT